MYRVGIGYDVHRLVESRPLIIGGVEIPYEKGLEGHSDADVLIHSICDAILGALSLGDIGEHFPDTDERFRGISSLKLLSYVRELAGEKGFTVENVDSVIVAQRPKLSPYREIMRKNIAETLKIPIERVSVKATTTEGLGFEGKGLGISAQSVVLLKKVGGGAK